MRGMSWRDGGEDDEVSYTFRTIPGPGQARPPLIFHPVTPINLTARHRLSLMTMASSTSGFDTSPPLRPFHPHFRRDFWHCDGESAKYPRTCRLSVMTRPRISRLRTPSRPSLSDEIRTLIIGRHRGGKFDNCRFYEKNVNSV